MHLLDNDEQGAFLLLGLQQGGGSDARKVARQLG
jgi:hypothetical protein